MIDVIHLVASFADKAVVNAKRLFGHGVGAIRRRLQQEIEFHNRLNAIRHINGMPPLGQKDWRRRF